MVAAAELRVRSLRRALSSTDQPADAPWLRLNAGARISLSGDALVVWVNGRWSRVRTSEPGAARTILDALRHEAGIGPELRQLELLGRLVDLGVLVPVATPWVVDLAGAARWLTQPAHACTSANDLPDSPSSTVLVLAPRDHPSLSSVLRAVAPRGAWVGLIADRSVIVANTRSGEGHGCARCAWLGDRDQVMGVPPVPVDGGLTLRGGSDWLSRRCAQLVDLLLLGVESVPDGHAWVESLGEPRATEPIARHPACACWIGATPVPDAGWDDLERRRFAPVWPVERGANGSSASARVVFRRSARGDVTSPATLGVALGSGPDKETLALSEAIERSSMHHAPPDLRDKTGLELSGRAWSTETIQALLFRPEERASPGFRFQDYDEERPIDWVEVRSLDGLRDAVVPAALVGHVDEASRLVAATSNGYASHRDRDSAVVGAILELVERDAILLSWFLGRPWARLVESSDDRSVYLCTQDIDLPVIFACACAEDGSLCSGSAAAVDLETALARSIAELEVALAARHRSPPRPPLELVDAFHGPEDHVARLSGESGRRMYDALIERSTTVRRADVDRWDTLALGDPLSRLTTALGAQGLEAWIADRSLPAVFGSGWHVVRAVVPGLVELSFGQGYRRLASPRVARALAAGEELDFTPHPLG